MILDFFDLYFITQRTPSLQGWTGGAGRLAAGDRNSLLDAWGEGWTSGSEYRDVLRYSQVDLWLSWYKGKVGGNVCGGEFGRHIWWSLVCVLGGFESFLAYETFKVSWAGVSWKKAMTEGKWGVSPVRSGPRPGGVNGVQWRKLWAERQSCGGQGKALKAPHRPVFASSFQSGQSVVCDAAHRGRSGDEPGNSGKQVPPREELLPAGPPPLCARQGARQRGLHGELPRGVGGSWDVAQSACQWWPWPGGRALVSVLAPVSPPPEP